MEVVLRTIAKEKEPGVFERVPISTVYVTKSEEAKETLIKAGIQYEGEVDINSVGFCKVETQQECLAGAFCIPKLMDVVEGRYRILFFINRKNIVIVDDTDFSEKIINRLNKKRKKPDTAKEKFIYNYIAEFTSRDLEVMGRYERRLMDLEDEVRSGDIDDFQNDILPIRKELLTLRGYYDELSDVGKALEENENGFLAKKHLRYFGIVSDRAERLMDKAAHMLEYAQQVRDAYQSEIDAKQNANMQFLTAISTIFFPLTLITGWYGMNFQNMPELASGYPFVILVSAIVVVICIVFFKKRHMF